MNVRTASESDADSLRALWEAFRAELPGPQWLPDPGWEVVWDGLRTGMADGAVVVALEGEETLGAAWASAPQLGRARFELVFVKREARRQGVGRALLSACLEELGKKGATLVSFEVPDSTPAALAIWRRLGLDELGRVLAAPLEGLRAKLADDRPEAASRAVIHVQTDDVVSVERAVNQFLPRLPSPMLGAESNGWIRIADPFLDGDREAQGRLAADVSDRLGTVSLVLAIEQGAVVRFRLYERGRMVDEYLSVPTFYGEIPKVEELSLAANPTIVSRLTGAQFEEVRQVARTAGSTAELPPVEDLYAQIARMMRVDP